MSSTISNVKSSDMFQAKAKLRDYLTPLGADYDIPIRNGNEAKETEWGWHNTVTARYLCPMKRLAEFDGDPE